MRGYLVLVALAGFAIVASSAVAVHEGFWGKGGSDSTATVSAHENLKPLPPGPPRETTAEATVGRATLEDMIAKAPIVFLGRVTAVGGSEVVSPASDDEGPELTIHRTRFDVLRALRGDTPKTVDVSQFDVTNAAPFEVGTSYVIFAEERLLGSTKTPALVPYGYVQGVYPQVAADVVRNELNGSIGITQLVDRLKETRKP